jgi:ParB family chromosome partitioning protein
VPALAPAAGDTSTKEAQHDERSTTPAITVLQAAHSPNESAKALREAAEFYKVDVAAITAKIKQEFAAKEKLQATRKAADKAKPSQPRTAAAKKAKAA